MSALRFLALLIAVVAFVAGCDGTAGRTDPPDKSEPAGVGAEPGEVTVPEQFRFTAETVDGNDFAGASLVGKPAVLWFWAPWCPTCQREAPMIAESARDHPDVTFVGVAALDEVPAMQGFVTRYDVGLFPHLADLDGSVWRRFGVTAQPAFAFIGADGSVEVVKGTLSEDDLSTRISALTGQ